MNKAAVLFFFFNSIIFSQKNYNKLSFEPSIVYSKPLSNVSPDGLRNFISFPKYSLAIRYMLNQKIGLRGVTNLESFEENGKGSNHYRFNLELYYNIGNWFELNRISNYSFALYSHFGIGGAYVNSKINGVKIGYIPGWEKQINLTLGLSPRFRLTDVISILTDCTYIIAMKQHFYYSGEPILNSGSSGLTGAQISFALGVSISIDNNYYNHVDFN